MMEDALRMIFKNPNKQHVIISSYDSKLSVGRTEQPSIDQLSQYIQVIINDEAHRLTGVQTKDAMDMFVESIQQHSQPLNLLMTATTDRTNTSLRDDYETIFSMTIQQAIDE
jgi:predicted helicase